MPQKKLEGIDSMIIQPMTRKRFKDDERTLAAILRRADKLRKRKISEAQAEEAFSARRRQINANKTNLQKLEDNYRSPARKDLKIKQVAGVDVNRLFLDSFTVDGLKGAQEARVKSRGQLFRRASQDRI